MYQFSRAIYRELAPRIVGSPAGSTAPAATTTPCCAPARRSSRAWPPTATTSRARRARCSATSAATSRCPTRGTSTTSSAATSGYAQQFLVEHPHEGYTAVSGAAAAVPGDDPQGLRLPAHAAAAQRLLPLPPAPRRHRGPRARGSLKPRRRLPRMLLGVDVGGTFTDAVLVGDGLAPSTPRRSPRRPPSSRGRARGGAPRARARPARGPSRWSASPTA